MFSRKKVKTKQIELSGISIRITRKNVKNINLRVYPRKKQVRISAPWHVREKVIHKFAESKMSWIQQKLASYRPEMQPEEPKFMTGESHWFLGQEYELSVRYADAKPEVLLDKENSTMTLQVRPGSDAEKRAHILKEWYRAELKAQIPKLVEKWEPVMNVKVNEFGVKQMKTRWGSCNIKAGRIWLNLELAKKTPACLEYVVVHEMVHLLERLHNKRFYSYMDQFLPNWRQTENLLQGKIDMP